MAKIDDSLKTSYSYEGIDDLVMSLKWSFPRSTAYYIVKKIL